MTNNQTTELHGIANPLRGFIRHQSNRGYIDRGQASWLTHVANEIDTRHEQVLSETLDNVRVKAYDSGFDSGVKACLQQLEGLIARGDTIDEINEWIDNQW